MGNGLRRMSFLAKAYKLDEQNGEALFYMAYTREEQGRKADAVLLYEKALAPGLNLAEAFAGKMLLESASLLQRHRKLGAAAPLQQRLSRHFAIILP